MKNIVRIFSIVVAATFLINVASAEVYVGDPVRKNTKNTRKAAECVPASGSSQLEVNNVRAYIETSGSMWFNSSKAQYFIPKSGNASSMFAAALWIGGMDVAGQLKLAALRFKQIGNDFWPGPLLLQDATVDQATCSMYDKHFYMTKVMARNHRDSFNIAGYSMPKEIKEWPGNPIDGNTKQSWFIAPYVDVDGDGSYNPENGDYPYYDFNNDLCPWTAKNRALAAEGRLPQTMETQNNISTGGIMADQVLKGDATLWWIFNDKGAAHTESKGSAIGLEIRAQAFGFATTDELNNMTFYSYEIINRSTYELTETYFSQWVDPDLGYSKDDYVGCDVERGLGYCYNGTAVDGNGLNTEYGANPPAVGVDFFQGPYLDADGYDNPSYKGDNYYGPSFLANYGNVCEIVTAHETAREFTWHLRFDSASGQWIDTTAFVPVRAEAINGVNFGDGIPDNERFGMRRFVYHNNDNSEIGDPSIAVDYYNMLRGIWKDNTPMRYGANGHYLKAGTGVPQCDFMFPGDTDPCNWGTKGINPGIVWTEETVGNAPEDRRFMQSAGPFTLKAGSINYITVGIPWARATGTPWASVLLLKAVDDKAQILFESCFKVVDGPDAPDLVFQEMDQKLICYMSNNASSNNYREKYREEDPSIPAYRVKSSIDTRMDTLQVVTVDTLQGLSGDSLVYNVYDTVIEVAVTISDTIPYDNEYVFEGYQVYQLVDANVGAAELTDNSKARLVYQCDIKNGVGYIVNHEYNASVRTEVPIMKVEGADKGILHSFEITEDKFYGSTLINHQKYYYMAVAYAYNNYETYGTSSDNPEGLFGQKRPYLSGNKNIKMYTVIPHKNAVEENGTIANSVYGTQPQITQMEGHGNGGNALRLTKATVEEILKNGKADSLVFEINAGPIGVKVIDPLQVHGSDYVVRFYNEDSTVDVVTDDTKWALEYTTPSGNDTIIESEHSISVQNEQLFTELGISITINNAKFAPLTDFIVSENKNAYYLYSTVSHISTTQETEGNVGIRFFADAGGSGISNWIRSGQTKVGDWALGKQTYEEKRQEDYYIELAGSSLYANGIVNVNSTSFTTWLDKDRQFEKILGSTWAPYALASIYDNAPGFGFESPEYRDGYGNLRDSVRVNDKPLETTYPLMTELYSVDIVFTADTSLWTRCCVVEIGSDSNATIGKAKRHNLRKSPSVDKNGKPDGTGYGMSWFPGYAICIETGERLNIMFGEDSRLGGDLYKGTDMIFNPPYSSGNDVSFGYQIGGGHYIYIMGHRDMYKDKSINGYEVEDVPTSRICPAYDEGQWLYNALKGLETNTNPQNRNITKNYIYKNAMWTAIPMTISENWLPAGSKTTISIRVTRPYERWVSTKNTSVSNPINNNMPLYKFTTKNIATQIGQKNVMETYMDSIRIVPNPYYGAAFGGYEASQVETKVKLVNLPKSCKVKIFTLDGTLIRSFDKPDDGTTLLEWDLKNSANIPIASGMYLIHIRDNEYNFEKTVKFLCIQRPFDVNAF